MRFKRLGQEEREPGKTQQPAQQNKCEKAADHNDRLNAQSTVRRAVSIASKTPPNGRSNSTAHPSPGKRAAHSKADQIFRINMPSRKRKSDGVGKSVTVRVESGGSRGGKKKRKKKR